MQKEREIENLGHNMFEGDVMERPKAKQLVVFAADRTCGKE